jgi:hypothetical protein
MSRNKPRVVQPAQLGGQLAAADALGRISLHPEVIRVLSQYKQMRTDEDRFHYADHFLSRTAGVMDEIWPIFYELLKDVEDQELYRQPSYVGKRTYGSFKQYFEERAGRPFKTWAQMESAYRYAQRFAPELLTNKLGDAITAQQRAQALDGKTINKKRQGGPLTKEEKANPYNIRVTEDGYGTNADYLTRRIARDHPDIFERMKAGEYKSVHAAALEAGIVARTITIRADDAESIAATLQRQLAPNVLEQLTKLLIRLAG